MYNPKVDAYIEKSAPFAQEILNHIRVLMHKTYPEINETVKWGMPFFETDKVIIGNMAAFKQHCSLGFWNASILPDPDGILSDVEKNGMGNLGKITSIKDLPKDAVLKKYFKAAANLEQNVVRSPSKDKPKIDIPEAFAKALSKNKTAKTQFEKMSPGKQKDYNQWIAEAKQKQQEIKELLKP